MLVPQRTAPNDRANSSVSGKINVGADVPQVGFFAAQIEVQPRLADGAGCRRRFLDQHPRQAEFGREPHRRRGRRRIVETEQAGIAAELAPVMRGDIFESDDQVQPLDRELPVRGRSDLTAPYFRYLRL